MQEADRCACPKMPCSVPLQWGGHQVMLWDRVVGLIASAPQSQSPSLLSWRESQGANSVIPLIKSQIWSLGTFMWLKLEGWCVWGTKCTHWELEGDWMSPREWRTLCYCDLWGQEPDSHSSSLIFLSLLSMSLPWSSYYSKYFPRGVGRVEL